MLKIIATAASTALAVGGAGYSYISKTQAHVAELERDNVTLHVRTERMDKALTSAIALLQEAQKHDTNNQ
jgi:hypothetical protein